MERKAKRGRARRRGAGVGAAADVVVVLGSMRDSREGGEDVVLGERAQSVRTTGTWVGELMGRGIEGFMTYEV